MRCKTLTLLAITAVAGFSMEARASILGTAESFAVLGAATVTNTNPATILGPTTITGDVGVWSTPEAANAVTGLLVTQVSGTIYGNGDVLFSDPDPQAKNAQTDLTTAYNGLAGMPYDFDLSLPVPGQLGGLVLTSGVYRFSSTAELTGTLTLDAQGLNNAYWVFQIGGSLTTATASKVEMINVGSDGGTFDGLFWQVGSSATLGTDTEFEGNILAGASITLNTRATIHNGRALARTGAVTMDTNTISIYSPYPNEGTLSGGLEFDVNGDVVPIGPSEGPSSEVIPEPMSLIVWSLIGATGAAAAIPRRSKGVLAGQSRTEQHPLDLRPSEAWR